MDIIESWVDEKEVRNYAMQLVAPYESRSSQNDEDFIVTEQQTSSTEAAKADITGAVEVATEAKKVDDMVDALTETSPVLSDSKAQQNAIKALQVAARKANESGVVANRFGKVTGIEEESGWEGHRNVSPELKQHLGDSAGALLNRDAVTSSLDTITRHLSETLNCSKISISDRDGDVFVDTMGNASWTNLTVSVTEPIRLLDIRQGAIGHGYMHLKLSAKDFLQVVVTSTSHGLIIIGMILEKQLGAEEAKELVSKVREII